jgi:hypothetical protein
MIQHYGLQVLAQQHQFLVASLELVRLTNKTNELLPIKPNSKSF